MQHTTQEAIEAVQRYGKQQGIDAEGAIWAAHNVRQGLSHGVAPDVAIARAKTEVDLWMRYVQRIDVEVAAHMVRDHGMEAG